MEPGFLCHVMDLKPSIVAGAQGCLCGGGGCHLVAGRCGADNVQVPTQPYLTSKCWLLFIAGLRVGICFSKWSPLIQRELGGLVTS